MAKAELLSGSDIRCRRLLCRCWHCGTQENDLILSPWKPVRPSGLAGSFVSHRSLVSFGTYTILNLGICLKQR